MNDVMSVERVSAPMQVMRAIRDAIRRGELKEGDKLPPENELAKQLKVGRSSFREGMRLLSAYGVVEILSSIRLLSRFLNLWVSSRITRISTS